MKTSSILRWTLALVAAAAAGCGRDSLVFSDSLHEWCDGAPCGWTLRAGSIALAPDGALLGGAEPARLERTQSVDLSFAPDDPFPGFLVVLSTGNSLLDLRWSDGTSEQLLLRFSEPTYLYLQLAPPRTAEGFAVSLSTYAGESALLDLVGVTRCAPNAANRHIGIDSALEGGRVLFWYYVEARYYTSFGSECPRGGGGGGGSDEGGSGE
jgi:hypothetical protein